MAPYYGCVEAYKVGLYGLPESDGVCSTPTISPPMAVQATDNAISILPSIAVNAGVAVPTADANSSVAATSDSPSSSTPASSTWTSGSAQVTVLAADASGPTTILPPTETITVTSTSTTVVDASTRTGVSNSTATSVMATNVTTTAASAKATSTVDSSSTINSNATATSSPIADDDCETDAADEEDAQTVTIYVTVHEAASAAAKPTKTVSKTVIVTDAPATSPPSAVNATATAAVDSTAPATTTTAAVNSTAADSHSSTVSVNSTSTSSSTETSTDTDFPASASLTLTSPTAEATATGSSNSSQLAAASKTQFSAPHNAIYAFSAFPNDTLPTVAELGKYNRLLLSFYAGSAGQDHNLQVWQNMTAEARNATLDAYHKAGIALMVSAFGGTVTPTTTGLDPKAIAKEIAEYAKQWGFDGVDIDYEDFDAINGGKSSAWLSEFQLTLRDSLGDGHLISHSPIAPWFDNKYYTIDGAYYSVNEKAGSTIDWYNVQYYNQQKAYADCDSLMHNSSTTLWPGTSLLELNSAHGIPLDKLVLGKPLEQAGAVNGGFMDMKTLGGCVAEGKAKGWKPALMFWEWDNAVDPASLLATALSG